jgi:hypothetical protein
VRVPVENPELQSRLPLVQGESTGPALLVHRFGVRIWLSPCAVEETHWFVDVRNRASHLWLAPGCLFNVLPNRVEFQGNLNLGFFMGNMLPHPFIPESGFKCLVMGDPTLPIS